MKIQCDICVKEEASVFCTADEAALCINCDNRVHNANKLASKHHRFSLFRPQFNESPLCDICQERKALLFCQQDRAFLCSECDIPIHIANVHTKRHSRFLLTCVKLSASASASATPDPSLYQASAISSSGSQSEAATTDIHLSSPNTWPTTQQDSGSTSSISEYLMETLPGWHFEDLLDPESFQIHDQISSSTNEEFGGNLDFSSSKIDGSETNNVMKYRKS